MLYVFAIQQRHSLPEIYLPAFHAATRCQTLITSIATPGSLAQRYGVVLQELRLELFRYNNHLQSIVTELGTTLGNGPMGVEGENSMLSHTNNLGMLGLGAGSLGLGQPGDQTGGQMSLADENLGFADGSPGSSIVQMTGWGQFDSLVSFQSTAKY